MVELEDVFNSLALKGSGFKTEITARQNLNTLRLRVEFTIISNFVINKALGTKKNSDHRFLILAY